jgi:hypothetical protein
MTDYAELLAQHNYAIVDVPAIQHEAWHDALPLTPIVPHDLRGDADKMPALLPLTPGEPYLKLLQYNLEKAESNPASHVLSCLLAIAPETSLSSVQWHLRNRLILHSPHGERALFRYYDSRVFVHLNRILNPERIRSLFGPIQTWTYRFQNQWHSATAPEINGIIPRLCSATTEQRQQLDNVGLINRTFSKWESRTQRSPRDLQEFDTLAAQAERALQTARGAYKLHLAEDLSAFALHSLMYGERFHVHTHIQRALRDIEPNAHEGYASASDMLDENEWAAVAARLN